jgi:hypothetical protein
MKDIDNQLSKEEEFERKVRLYHFRRTKYRPGLVSLTSFLKNKEELTEEYINLLSIKLKIPKERIISAIAKEHPF